MVNVKRSVLCVVYALIAVVAFVGTWGQNYQYLRLHLGFWGFQETFYKNALINPAAGANSVDLTCFGLAVFIWMMLEAQRLNLKGIWIYPVAFMLIGISIAVPVFLIHRQRALEARDGSPIAGTMSKLNVAALVVGSIGIVIYTGWLLQRAWQYAGAHS